MIVRYSLVTLGFFSDWSVDVEELLLSEPHKYIGVSLCNFVHWCWEYISSASGAQHFFFSFFVRMVKDYPLENEERLPNYKC